MAVTDLLKTCPIFFDLFDKEIEKVVKSCKVFRYGRGESIVKEGDPSSEILILLEGDASAQKNLDGTLHVLEHYRKGSVFGFLVLVEEKNYPHHVIADGEAHVLKIPFQNLLAIFDSDARVFGIISLNLCRMLAARLEKLRHSIHQEAITLKQLNANLEKNAKTSADKR
jgi:CRP/FNR family transcriptional regulator, cyclic AMP receptor protein